MVVVVVVVGGSDKVHLVDAATLGAALNGALLGKLKYVSMDGEFDAESL